ncbi:hypothetical protein ACQ4N7_08835 [Nodosilinea sp. AN01ver1]|uniref:hypothetical protein n=1 Tax=Nodosilinea sp. AN01ver1 TaxID=3423362 RepID=UPI003D30F1FF
MPSDNTKVLRIACNASPPEEEPKINIFKASINLDCLFGHLFRDLYDQDLPETNYLGNHYLLFLTKDGHFRFNGSGVGAHKEAKISESKTFGKAFCRWYLQEYCNVTYFHHIDHILDRTIEIDGICYRLERKRNRRGDIPDYLCSFSKSYDAQTIFLGEAKGSQTKAAMSTNPEKYFLSKKFMEWNEQFKRMHLVDKENNELRIKGYLVATFLGNENHLNCETTVLAEDPFTPGNTPISPAASLALRRTTIAGHYASLFHKLGLPQLSQALRRSITPYRLPASYYQGELSVLETWTTDIISVAEHEFVGVFFYPPAIPRHYIRLSDLEQLQEGLQAPELMFLGLHRKIFDQVLRIVEVGPEAADEVMDLSEVTGSDPNITPEAHSTIFRDGSILAPLEHFRHLGNLSR